MSRPVRAPQVCSMSQGVAATAAGAGGRLVNSNDDVTRVGASYHNKPQVHAELTPSHTNEMANQVHQ